MKKLKAKGCCLVGHPQYYRQFCFKNVEGLVCKGVPQEVFFALPFEGDIPLGEVIFHEGFKANGAKVEEYLIYYKRIQLYKAKMINVLQ